MPKISPPPQETGLPVSTWYLECTTKGHNKYYEITLWQHESKFNVSTHWGRIGNAGSTTWPIREMSRSSAEDFIYQTMRDKKAKGYKEKVKPPTHSINVAATSNKKIDPSMKRFAGLLE